MFVKGTLNFENYSTSLCHTFLIRPYSHFEGFQLRIESASLEVGLMHILVKFKPKVLMRKILRLMETKVWQ